MQRRGSVGALRRWSVSATIRRAHAIHHIAAVRLDVRSRRAKFKLAQNRPPEVRAKIAEALRTRGRPNDERAAEALHWTIDQEAKR